MILPQRTVVITGATGFIGQCACSWFMAHGWNVRGLTRSPTAVLPDGVSVFRMRDFADTAAIAPALARVQVVLHLAARVHQMKDRSTDAWREYQHSNVDGTRLLATAARTAGVGCLILASSVKAVGESNLEQWTEDTPARPSTAYGISKLQAEDVIREITTSGDMRAVIVRLPMVYGPGMKGNMLRLFRLVETGIPLPFGSLNNRRSVAYVGNVVTAFSCLVDAPGTGSETFFVADDEPLSVTRLINLIAGALGRRARLISIPASALQLAATIGDRIASVAPAWPIQTASINRLFGSLSVSTQKIHAVANDWAPVSTEIGLNETAHWYRQVSGGVG